jgi:glucarate dehydratase
MPLIESVEVVPVAGDDSMLLNLSGAHAPSFTRTIVLVTDADGRIGAGECPGGERIAATLREAGAGLVGRRVEHYRSLLREISGRYAGRDAGGRGLQTFDLRVTVHVVAALESALLDLEGQRLGLPVAELLGDGQVRTEVPVLGYLFFVGDAEGTDLSYAPPAGEGWASARRRPALDAAAIVGLAEHAQVAYGFRDFKLKGGVFSPSREADVIHALADRFPDARITIDPNGAWSLAEAVDIGRSLRGRIAYAEDPCGAERGYSGREILAEFRRATGIPVATNMVATDWRELAHALRSDAIDIPLADLHFWTLSGAVRVAQLGAAFGLTWGSHSNNHFDVSLAMLAHVGAAAPGPITALDTHWIWQDGQNLTVDPPRIADGMLHCPAGPGLGITLDETALAAAHERYLRLGSGERDDAEIMGRLVTDWVFDPKRPSYVR